MKSTQDLSEFVNKTAEIVVDAINRQVKQFVRLVTKAPKKPPLAWDQIIGDSLLQKAPAHAALNQDAASELPEANQQLAQLPIEIFDELFNRIQKNIVDEIQALRLYEKLFDCEIQIMRGHVHFYKCTHPASEETIDYTTLISRLIQLFTEHQEITSRHRVLNR
jgi:hypothetical protein